MARFARAFRLTAKANNPAVLDAATFGLTREAEDQLRVGRSWTRVRVVRALAASERGWLLTDLGQEYGPQTALRVAHNAGIGGATAEKALRALALEGWVEVDD